MTSEIEAAGRLRKMDAGEDINKLYDCVEPHLAVSADGWNLARAYLRETDPRLVDEAFAKSVALSSNSYPSRDGDGRTVIYRISNCREEVRITFERNGRISLLMRVGFWDNPTIGDFYTACRLFRVTVTPTGAKEQ